MVWLVMSSVELQMVDFASGGVTLSNHISESANAAPVTETLPLTVNQALAVSRLNSSPKMCGMSSHLLVSVSDQAYIKIYLITNI